MPRCFLAAARSSPHTDVVGADSSVCSSPELAAALQMLQRLRAGTWRSPLIPAGITGCVLGPAFGLQKECAGCCL